MDLSGGTIQVMLVLLPGFLSSTILNAITARSPRTNLIIVFEALAFSLAVYIVSVIFMAVLMIKAIGDTNLLYTTIQYLVVGIVAIILPCAIGFSINHDIHMSLLRSLGITRRTARESVWADIFNDQHRRYVVVNLRNGQRIQGWPLYYSDTPEEGTLFLEEPAWINADGKMESMKKYGILLPREVIETIEFCHIEAE